MMKKLLSLLIVLGFIFVAYSSGYLVGLWGGLLEHALDNASTWVARLPRDIIGIPGSPVTLKPDQPDDFPNGGGSSGDAPPDPSGGSSSRSESPLTPSNEHQTPPKEESLPPDEQKPDVTLNEFIIQGVTLAHNKQMVEATLGAPARTDLSEYGFEWWIYNADYRNYIQVGVLGDDVVALYTNGSGWISQSGISLGTSQGKVREIFGQPLDGIQKGNTIYRFPANSPWDVFLHDGIYITLFYDIHQGNTVTAIHLVIEEIEVSLQGFFGEPSPALQESFSIQSLDLANAIRARWNLPALSWDDTAAYAAYLHSEDMALNDYFSHENLDGQSPFDRLSAAGVEYRSASENIAAGYKSAIYVHEGWMNSEGHRQNVLGDYTRLGVGTYLGGSNQTYYTQKFYTPR